MVRCLIVDDEPMAREILKSHLSKMGSIKILAECKNAFEAFDILSKETVDLLFLDINMPELSGLSLAKTIQNNCKVIFTTAYREYAVDGFDLKAVDYILKPISFERLLQAINKYMEEQVTVMPEKVKLIKDEVADHIFVRADRKMVKVRFQDLSYIESLSDYIKIHLCDKAIITRESISSIEAKLPKNDFIRTHRSYIVAKSCIESFTNEVVELRGTYVPISRNYKNEVMRILTGDS